MIGARTRLSAIASVPYGVMYRVYLYQFGTLVTLETSTNQYLELVAVRL